MVSSFQLGQVERPLEQVKYSTPGAMEQEGLQSLKTPWASVVVPAIWDNVETSGEISFFESKVTPSTVTLLAPYLLPRRDDPPAG